MKQYKFWMLTAILALCGQTVMTSCSSNDDNSVAPANNDGVPGTAQRSYSLDWKILNDDRQLVALDGAMGNMFRAEMNQIQFEYTSVGPDLKTPVRMTGTINMPRHIFNKTEESNQLIIFHQWTHAQKDEQLFDAGYNDIGIYMNEDFNVILISSDYYGWTLTKDNPQAYCCHEINAVAQLDCYDAAMEILKQKGYKVDGLPINSLGYSSGGMLAVGFQKYISEHRPDIHIAFTGIGASPYDINTVYENYVETDFTGYVCSMPLIMVSFNETYNLGLDYKDIFLPPLCDHISDWILSKQYLTSEINERIGIDKKVSEILTPAACDWTKGIGKVMHDKFAEKSLCGANATWQPDTETSYYVMHSTGDLYMDWHVSEQMANYLKSKGCTKLTTDFRDFGNHCENGVPVFLLTTAMLMYMQDDEYKTDQDLVDLLDGLADLVINVASNPELFAELAGLFDL